MIAKILELEENILQHKEYLLSRYENTDELLSQISTILDFGIDNDRLNKWYQLNKISIKLIYTLIKERKESESSTHRR